MIAHRRRTAMVAVALLAVAAAVAGCSGSSGTRGAASALTALGDSVPAGSACECVPYPRLTASDMAHATGRTVRTRNWAVAGFTTGDVLDQVDQDAHVIAQLATTDVVLVQVGANDVAYSSACGTDAACYVGHVPTLTANLEAIVARLHTLTAGRPVPILLLDYWSVWLGGDYAREQGDAYVTAAERVTTDVNAAIARVAHESGSIHVDVRKAFRGPSDNWDETHLLAPDGDHPNAEGHQRIAQAIALTLRTRRP